MKKSNMFKKAHLIARGINDKVGNYSIAFSIALKRIWKMVKAGRKKFSESAIKNAIYTITHKPYTGPKYFAGVPDWLISKNFDQQESQAIWNYCFNTSSIKETAKAILMKFETDFGNLFSWVPKSVYKGSSFNN